LLKYATSRASIDRENHSLKEFMTQEWELQIEINFVALATAITTIVRAISVTFNLLLPFFIPAT